ncbi:unnamed protein product, partial [Brachionus calyciflorus]
MPILKRNKRFWQRKTKESVDDDIFSDSLFSSEEEDPNEYTPNKISKKMTKKVTNNRDDKYELRIKRVKKESIKGPDAYRRKLRKRVPKKSNESFIKGLKLGDIPKIRDSLHECSDYDLNIICKICSIDHTGIINDREKSLRKLGNFNGFINENIEEKIELVKDLSPERLKKICKIFGVDSNGSDKRDIAERVIEFLQ